MGRDARLAKQTGPIDNRGHLDRVETAVGHFLDRLRADPRVAPQYPVWCQGRELPRLMTVQVSHLFPELEAAAWTALMDAVCRPASEAEISAVEAVLDGIGPLRRWPRRWATEALTRHVFPAAFYTAIQRPDLAQPLWFTLRDDGQVRITYGPPPAVDPEDLARGGRWVMTKRGNRPQAIGHQKVRDAVDTWYQAYLQDSPVPKAKLTEDYAKAAGRYGAAHLAHSVVDDRLELAETLINRLILD